MVLLRRLAHQSETRRGYHLPYDDWMVVMLNLVFVQMRASSGFRLVSKPSRQHHRGPQLARKPSRQNNREHKPQLHRRQVLIRKETSKETRVRYNFTKVYYALITHREASIKVGIICSTCSAFIIL